MPKKKKWTEADAELVRAVAGKDAAAVRKALAAGADPNTNIATEPQLYFPALLDAADTGELSVVKLLLDAGADIHAKSNYDFSALSIAVSGGHLPVVKLLLARGADVHASIQKGQGDWSATILTDALNNADSAPPPSMELVTVLLEAGANPNLANGKGMTPLMLAAEAGRMKFVETLLEAGADPRMNGGRGLFAVDMAERHGHKKLEKLLRDKGSPSRVEAAAARLAYLWSRIGGWFKKNARPCYTQLGKARGASAEAIAELEQALQSSLPADFRAYLELFGVGKGRGLLFFRHEGLWLPDIRTEWEARRAPSDKGAGKRQPAELKKGQKKVQWKWWDSKWVPFARDARGNLYCVDLHPRPDGDLGQVIQWSPDKGPSLPVSKSFIAFIERYVEELDKNIYRYEDGILLADGE